MPDIETIEGLMTEARHFHNVVQTRPTDYQITQAQADMLNDLATAAETTLAARTAAEEALILSRANFKTAFDLLAKFFRALRQSVKDNPATSDADRAELHLTTGDGDDDETGRNPLEFAPLSYVENAGVHIHLVRFFMQGEESDSTRKPKGVKGCNIYQKIGGEATTNLKDYRLITMDTKSPYNYEHDAADAGKTAHYVCCWVDNDDDLSPQSEAFSIVIT